jgi:hypothetical protein
VKTSDNLIQINQREIQTFKELRKLSDTKLLAEYLKNQRVIEYYENADSFRQWGHDRVLIENAEREMRYIYDFIMEFRPHLKARI